MLSPAIRRNAQLGGEQVYRPHDGALSRVDHGRESCAFAGTGGENGRPLAAPTDRRGPLPQRRSRKGRRVVRRQWRRGGLLLPGGDGPPQTRESGSSEATARSGPFLGAGTTCERS